MFWNKKYRTQAHTFIWLWMQDNQSCHNGIYKIQEKIYQTMKIHQVLLTSTKQDAEICLWGIMFMFTNTVVISNILWISSFLQIKINGQSLVIHEFHH